MTTYMSLMYVLYCVCNHTLSMSYISNQFQTSSVSIESFATWNRIHGCSLNIINQNQNYNHTYQKITHSDSWMTKTSPDWVTQIDHQIEIIYIDLLRQWFFYNFWRLDEYRTLIKTDIYKLQDVDKPCITTIRDGVLHNLSMYNIQIQFLLHVYINILYCVLYVLTSIFFCMITYNIFHSVHTNTNIDDIDVRVVQDFDYLKDNLVRDNFKYEYNDNDETDINEMSEKTEKTEKTEKNEKTKTTEKNIGVGYSYTDVIKMNNEIDNDIDDDNHIDDDNVIDDDDDDVIDDDEDVHTNPNPRQQIPSHYNKTSKRVSSSSTSTNGHNVYDTSAIHNTSRRIILFNPNDNQRRKLWRRLSIMNFKVLAFKHYRSFLKCRYNQLESVRLVILDMTNYSIHDINVFIQSIRNCRSHIRMIPLIIFHNLDECHIYHTSFTNVKMLRKPCLWYTIEKLVKQYTTEPVST